MSSADCISRQEAIDALCNDYCGGHQDCKHYPKCENLRSIQKLPSAQPEIIRCKDCKWCENADVSMCKNPASWIVATDRDFGCVLAERRTDDQSK